MPNYNARKNSRYSSHQVLKILFTRCGTPTARTSLMSSKKDAKVIKRAQKNRKEDGLLLVVTRDGAQVSLVRQGQRLEVWHSYEDAAKIGETLQV